MKKYELTSEYIINALGVKLFRIKAVRKFGGVEVGELGGYIEKEDNLSQDGEAWVCGDAQVYGNAYVCGDAWVSGDVQVYGDAYVGGKAWVCDTAQVLDKAQVYGGAQVCGDAQVDGNTEVYGNAVVYRNGRREGKE